MSKSNIFSFVQTTLFIALTSSFICIEAVNAAELKPTYRSSYSTQTHDNRWAAENDIWDAEGWPGSEMAIGVYNEDWSIDALRTLYRVRNEWRPKVEYFGPTLWTSELQTGLCNDCPLYDAFGNERCSAGDQAMCASESAIDQAIEAHFSNYCDYYIDSVTPWFFIGYSSVGPGLPDGTQVYGTWFKKLYTVKYWQQPLGCIGDPGYKEWIYDASAYSWTACPTGYYDASTLAPDGSESCSNHFAAWLYEYNPLEFGGECPAGNPCYPKTGAKSLSETDFVSPTLELTRSWNSLARYRDYAAMGRGWTHNYSQRLLRHPTAGQPLRKLLDGKGAVEYFECTDEPACTVYRSQKNPGWLLRPFADGWEVLAPGGERRVFDAQGRLTQIERRGGRYGLVAVTYADDKVERVTDQSGRSLVFNYNSDDLVDSVTLPGGGSILYDYDRPASIPSHVTWQQRVVRVTRQDLSERIYHYEDHHPDLSPRFEFLVTGITDENGVRYATYSYDENARVVSSGHALGADLITLNYTSRPGEVEDWTITEVTGPLGEVVTYEMESGPFRKLTGLTDSRGDLSIDRDPVTTWRTGRTDRRGFQATYDYSDGLHETRRVEAAGTPEQRAIETDWDISINRVLERREPGKKTTYTHNSRGQILTKTDTDTLSMESRQWAYTYYEAPSAAELIGRVETVDGPRTDVADLTTHEYYTGDDPGGAYRKGDLRETINALGHVTEFLSYDHSGRPLQMRDANGIVTEITYHPRGWVQSGSVDGQVTAFSYDSIGNLTRVTQPDGSFTAYEYDAAHRLFAISDNYGNRIEFTLDAAGNRVGEHTYNDEGVLRLRLTREFDQLSRLKRVVDGNLRETLYEYDVNGNRTSVLDPGLNLTRFEYDPLGRLVQSIDAAMGETFLSYDDRDNLVAVSDPLGNITSYTHDGLDNPLQQDSPDSGVTVNEFDDAGNRTASTDARGARVEYEYDALNRLVFVDYADDSLDVSFTYDSGANGKGRLTAMSDAAGQESYTYDERGNLIGVEREIDGTTYSIGYAYNPADRLIRTVYPTGMTIDYTLDSAGRVTAVNKTVNGVTEQLVTGVVFEPFGPLSAFSYGNGLTMVAVFDDAYELDSLQSGPALDWTFDYDNAGNILAISDQFTPANSQAFAYDELHRLVSAGGTYGNEDYEYDANGNRARYRSDKVDDPYLYAPQSNRLAAQNGWSITRDGAGNRFEKLDAVGAGQLLAYGEDNRMKEVIRRQIILTGNGKKPRRTEVDTVVGNYVYDGRGQRVKKSTTTGVTHFIFGKAGELLGEYLGDGSATKEYVWLGGQPVAMITHAQLSPAPVEVIVDNDTAGTAQIGDWTVETSNKDYGADYRRADGAGNSYRWTPALAAGDFEVFAWWVSKKQYASVVDYRISRGGATEVVTRSHSSGGGQWQSLGTWEFDGSGGEYVEVAAANGVTTADAVKFVRVGGGEETRVATYFVHSDHLGTPRAVSDASQTTVWRWDSRPFGDSAPDEDPDGDGSDFVLNLRFPGQYFDAETGLHYNYFRYFDPSIGRYVESDPIGLKAGLNTFSYVIGNPLRFVDPAGLEVRGSWIDMPTLVDYDIDFEGISLGERFDIRGLVPGLSLAYLLYSYTGTVQAAVYCIDDDECNTRRWMISPRFNFDGDFQYRIWLTPIPNPWGIALTLANAGVEATDIAKFIYDELFRAADLVKDRGPTALCIASDPAN